MFIFSCLVDADYLDTQSFVDEPTHQFYTLDTLRQRFSRYMDTLAGWQLPVNNKIRAILNMP